MEMQAAPVSAAPAAPSTETTPKAAASVPPAGDEAPPAAPTAEAPPVNTRLSPTDEDPTAGAAAPPAEAEHTPSSNEADQTPSSNGSDNEEDGACGVCGSKHSEEEDALIFCDGCDVAVHQLCYNISDETAASAEDWFCEACQELREGKRDASPLKCVICESGRPNGTDFYRDVPLAFKRATSLPRAYAKERLVNDPHGSWRDCWAHVACAAWVPECGFVDENRQIAALCGDLSEVRSKGKCDFCGERGQIVQCSRKRCAASFHPACILRELMGPREWSRRWDAGHPGAFVRYAGAAEAVGEVICGKHCGVTDDKAPSAPVAKSDYELQRDARIAQNQAFLASLGLGAAQSPQKSPTRRKRRRGPTQPAARKSARECAQAVQPGQYAPPPQRRSEAEIEEEREERAAERLAKFLKRADKAAAGAAAADAREYLRFARFLAERPVDAAAAALLYERWAREGPAFFARFREEEKLRKQRARADEQARRRAEKEAALLRKDADRAARVADKCGADNAIRAARALLKELRKSRKKKARRPAAPEPAADEGDLYARPYKKRKKRHVPTPNVRLRVVSNAAGTVSEDMPRFVNVKCGASVARAMLPDKLWPGRFAPRPRSYAYVALPPSVQPARRAPSLPMDVLGFTGLS